MKLYLAAFNDGRGWQAMKRAKSAETQRLCVYGSYDSAVRAITNMKYRYKEETDFKVIPFVEA